MNTENKVTRFKRVFCNTLKTDDNGNYLRIPIADYQDLSYFRNNIVSAIDLIADLQITGEHSINVSDLAFTIKSLLLILENSSMIEECNGIDELFN